MLYHDSTAAPKPQSPKHNKLLQQPSNLSSQTRTLSSLTNLLSLHHHPRLPLHLARPIQMSQHKARRGQEMKRTRKMRTSQWMKIVKGTLWRRAMTSELHEMRRYRQQPSGIHGAAVKHAAILFPEKDDYQCKTRLITPKKVPPTNDRHTSAVPKCDTRPCQEWYCRLT